jgi:hypothetical protein
VRVQAQAQVQKRGGSPMALVSFSYKIFPMNTLMIKTATLSCIIPVLLPAKMK